jgi:hypothetical protein
MVSDSLHPSPITASRYKGMVVSPIENGACVLLLAANLTMVDTGLNCVRRNNFSWYLRIYFL